MRVTANPPPPMLPAVGYVTASANAVATAASAALPPAFRTSRPTPEAIASSVTTIPLSPRTTTGVMYGQVSFFAGAPASTSTFGGGGAEAMTGGALGAGGAGAGAG